MKYYNLYYKGVKINNRPINEEEKANVIRSKEIYKRNSISKRLEKINADDVSYVETIII